jgi:superfamily II DNA/RNA helicase
VRCAAVFGKQPFDTQVRELKQRTHVVVGTPGRTFDHMERGSLNTEEIKYLIIDEADEMLNMGFIEQVETIINKLPKDRVTMLFSATIPEAVERLCQRYMKDPKKIEITPKEITTDRIEHLYYEVREEDKFSLLNKLLIVEKPESCIIFCRTKENVDDVEGMMKLEGLSCSGLHGGMMQSERLETMRRFKRGEFTYLVATDVAARGIDVEDITHIINYDISLSHATIKSLESMGVRFTHFHPEAILAGGGSLRCLTLRLLRE